VIDAATKTATSYREQIIEHYQREKESKEKRIVAAMQPRWWCGASWCNCDEKRKEQRSSAPAICSAARARIDDSVRQVWMAYRDASDVSVDMLTEQDMELWGIVTRHVAIQDRLNAMLPNDRS
jgi:hypothetical protein